MRRALVVVAVVAVVGCKKSKQDAPGVAAGSATEGSGSDTGSGSAGSGSAAPADTGSTAPAPAGSGSAVAAAPPAIEGTAVKLTAVGAGDHPFSITVPAGYKHAEETDVGDEELPYATVKGPDFEIRLESPEAGYFELEDEKAMIVRGNPGAKFDLAEAESDGWSLVYAEKSGKYFATVQRKSLSLACSAAELASLEHAMTAIAICRTIK